MNKADLYKPVVASTVGPAPLVIRAVITPSNDLMQGASMASTRGESYVLLSALPQELQERVKTAVQMMLGGIVT